MRIGAGSWQAEILPERGAAVARLDFAGNAVLVPLPDGADPTATRAGAFWMLPWTNRLDGGRFPWNGEHCFPLNKPEEGNAIHGLGRDRPWQVVEQGMAEVVLVQELTAPPFRYAARLRLRAAQDAFLFELTMRNEDDKPCPMGFGWHPWFVRQPGASLRFGATTRLTQGARNLPGEGVAESGPDGAAEPMIGADSHYAGWNSQARLAWPGIVLEMTASGDWARNLHLHLPDAAPAICLEPVSHVPDAINRPDLAPLGAMRVLAPGEALHGTITLKAYPV
ncbi:aldose epimerase [Pseudoroseomonas globiformis]|uniref:Aldose epimerase n=1 Tax=Teichococcus globiformis TaxID=2307229 RepID=A0ABV7G6P0_9PROT